MEKALAKDWMSRLSSLYNIWLRSEGSERCRAEVGLRRVLLGEMGWILDYSSRSGQRFMDDLTHAMEDCMRPPVPDLLDCIDSNATGGGNGEYVWSVYADDAQRQFNETCYGSIDTIAASCDCEDENPGDFAFYKRARFMEKVEHVLQSSYRYNCVDVGEAVSAVVADNSGSEIGTPMV